MTMLNNLMLKFKLDRIRLILTSDSGNFEPVLSWSKCNDQYTSLLSHNMHIMIARRFTYALQDFCNVFFEHAATIFLSDTAVYLKVGIIPSRGAPQKTSVAGSTGGSKGGSTRGREYGREGGRGREMSYINNVYSLHGGDHCITLCIAFFLGSAGFRAHPICNKYGDACSPSPPS